MRKHLRRIIIPLALIAFLLSGWTIIAQRQTKHAAVTLRQPAWEYKVTGPIAEKDMNALGADGWELAGVSAYADNFAFYFKRRKR
jgi:lipopolysaccharide export system protein LptC